MTSAKPSFAAIRDISWREVWLVPLCMALAPFIYVLLILIYACIVKIFSGDADIVGFYFTFGLMATAFFFYFLYLPSCLIALLVVIGLKLLRLTQRWSYMAGGLLAGLLPASVSLGWGASFLPPVLLTATLCGWIYWRMTVDPTPRRSRGIEVWLLVGFVLLVALVSLV